MDGKGETVEVISRAAGDCDVQTAHVSIPGYQFRRSIRYAQDKPSDSPIALAWYCALGTVQCAEENRC
jgi:hypothetical protein